MYPCNDELSQTAGSLKRDLYTSPRMYGIKGQRELQGDHGRYHIRRIAGLRVAVRVAPVAIDTHLQAIKSEIPIPMNTIDTS